MKNMKMMIFLPSHRKDGEYTSNYTIEGKKAECKSIDSLRYQLFADMELNCVRSFIIKYYQEYSDVSIQNINQLSGYGIDTQVWGTLGFIN